MTPALPGADQMVSAVDQGESVTIGISLVLRVHIAHAAAECWDPVRLMRIRPSRRGRVSATGATGARGLPSCEIRAMRNVCETSACVGWLLAERLHQLEDGELLGRLGLVLFVYRFGVHDFAVRE